VVERPKTFPISENPRPTIADFARTAMARSYEGTGVQGTSETADTGNACPWLFR
jgi:hypothetical protein